MSSKVRRIAGIAIASAAVTAPAAQADVVNVSADAGDGAAHVAVSPSGVTAQVGAVFVGVNGDQGLALRADTSREMDAARRTARRAADTSQERSAARRTVRRSQRVVRRTQRVVRRTQRVVRRTEQGVRRSARRACGIRVLRGTRTCRVALRVVG